MQAGAGQRFAGRFLYILVVGAARFATLQYVVEHADEIVIPVFLGRAHFHDSPPLFLYNFSLKSTESVRSLKKGRSGIFAAECVD